jgi:O-antigen/teichoic acid export membrane protein
VSLLSHSRRLLKDVATYGLGDVATSIINVLLIPIYSRILTTEEVGIIALLVGLEAGMKIVLRWGVDSAFMRLYVDCRDEGARQTLASTIWLFLLGLNAPVFAIAIAFAPELGEVLFGVPGYTATLRIFLINTFLLTFTFIPFHVYRIEGRTRRFAALTFTRAFGSVLLRLLLIVQLGIGVIGVVIADLLLTFVVFAAMMPTFVALLRPRFDRRVLAEALHFGGPRVPHGIAHQVTATADRWMLRQSGAPLGVIGIYGMGATVALGMKLFLSAFEYAWAPFYLDTMRRPEAKQIYSRITTYVTAVLALLAAGMAALAHDVIQLLLAPKFWESYRVVPWIGLGVLFQGFYQLTAIGLNITKRTASLPLATITAAAIAIGLNFVLLPRVGMIGAAWTYTASYAAMAIVGMTLSQRVYPIAYEWRRLAQLALAALLAWAAGRRVAEMPLPLAVRVLVSGAAVTAAYPLVLWVLRFFRPGEVQMLVKMRDQLTSVARRTSPGEETELGGGITDAPSIVDHTEPDAADPPKSRKVE